MTIKKSHLYQIMNLNNSLKKYCFSAIFDPSYHSKNYPNKKGYIKKAFWLQLQARASMKEL